MSQIIALTSGRPLGCTFLDWSLHWLAGHRQHWNFHLGDWAAIPADPLVDRNAHAHQKNHPAGDKELEHMLAMPVPRSGSDFTTVYYNFQQLPHWLAVLGIPHQNLSRHHWHTIQQLQLQQLRDMSRLCQQYGVLQIAAKETSGTELYFLHARVIADWMPTHVEPDIAEYLTWFGVETELPRWDLREQIALDIRPFEPTCLRDYVPLQCNHLCITDLDLWVNGVIAIPKLLQDLDIALDQTRWHHWCTVYAKWQHIQKPYVDFAQQAIPMVQDIINDRPRLLPRLTLLQEAAIQHCLIYLHDMNIRNWKLDAFPNNTRDLHQLLEPNQHPITDVTYRDLLRRSIDSLRSSIP